MTSYTARVIGGTSQPSYQSYVSFTIDDDLQLNWPSAGLNSNDNIAIYTEINALNPNLTVSLPNALQVGTGTTVNFVNTGTNPFMLLDFTGGDLLEINIGGQLTYYLADNTTPTGIWKVFASTISTTPAGVTSVSAESISAGLGINGSPITNVGILQFTLDEKLSALSEMNTTGFVCLDETNSTILNRTLTAGNNITIGNPTGVLGDPVIGMNLVVDNLTSVSATNGAFTNLTVTNFNAAGSMRAFVSWNYPVSNTIPVILKSFNVTSVVSFSASGVRVNFTNPVLNALAMFNSTEYGITYNNSNQISVSSAAPFIVGTLNPFITYTCVVY